MGSEGSKFKLSAQNRASFIVEYENAGGITDKTSLGGWSREELHWLVHTFAMRCCALQEIRNQSQTQGKRKESKSFIPTLQSMKLRKQDAIENIVVFNQSFINYPSLADRFWRLLTKNQQEEDICTFLDYTSLMYKVVRGSWEDRTLIAFDFFDSQRTGQITKDHIRIAIHEISEFVCNVARGLIHIKEFNEMKMKQVEDLFASTSSTSLSIEEFRKLAASHNTIISCCDILDMIFGRVIRKMEKDVGKDIVFGRHLQETALGNAKDVTGEMPFVPEVVASAIYLLQEKNACGTPELFRKSVSIHLLEDVKKELNKGITLRTYFQRFKDPSSTEFMLLANLIKYYCNSLKEPAFTLVVFKKLVEIENSDVSVEEKLQGFKKSFSQLPTTNRYFLSTLLRFLKEVSLAQIARNGNGCMSSDNLGIVFAPSTMYDPADPSYGVTTATKIFTAFINHADEINPNYSIDIPKEKENEIKIISKEKQKPNTMLSKTKPALSNRPHLPPKRQSCSGLLLAQEAQKQIEKRKSIQPAVRPTPTWTTHTCSPKVPRKSLIRTSNLNPESRC